MLRRSFFKLVGAGSSLLLLTSCASIVDGTSESVSLSTVPVSGASCLVSNSKGKWTVASTPATLKVHRSSDDLSISCHKAGYKVAQKHVKSSAKAMAFGNVLLGGPIGAGIDIANGSAFDYPSGIVMTMKPIHGSGHKLSRRSSRVKAKKVS